MQRHQWKTLHRSLLSDFHCDLQTLILVPLLVCIVLYLLQQVIDSQITDDPANQCGCRCTRCCDWVAGSDGEQSWKCQEASTDFPCPPSAQVPFTILH